MSSWVVEDFNETFSQQFTVVEKMIVDFISIKLMKAGTINPSAVFTIKFFNSEDGSGFNLLGDNSDAILTADTVNNVPASQIPLIATEPNYRANYNIRCPGLVLNTNLDGTPKKYFMEFIGENYSPTPGMRNNVADVPIDNSLGVCRRQADDNSINLSGPYPTGFDTLGLQAIIDPLHIEFGVLE